MKYSIHKPALAHLDRPWAVSNGTKDVSTHRTQAIATREAQRLNATLSRKPAVSLPAQKRNNTARSITVTS